MLLSVVGGMNGEVDGLGGRSCAWRVLSFYLSITAGQSKVKHCSICLWAVLIVIVRRGPFQSVAATDRSLPRHHGRRRYTTKTLRTKL
jgi:hypothetical protein